jgi:transposase
MQSESSLDNGVERLRSNGKRVYTLAHKRSVVELCLVPGASVARVALAHGINANLVRKWIDKCKADAIAPSPSLSPTLLPVTIAGVEPSPASELTAAAPSIIEVDVHGARVRLLGPVQAERLRIIFDALARRA